LLLQALIHIRLMLFNSLFDKFENNREETTLSANNPRRPFVTIMLRQRQP
jgi:hypothetical protein